MSNVKAFNWLLVFSMVSLAVPLPAGEIAGSGFFERSFHRLFSIHRSTNENEIIYEARSTPEGFDTYDPIKAYWVMKSEGESTEPLTAIERSWAYGVLIKEVSANQIIFALKVLPDRNITVHRTGEKVFPTMVLSGEECVLASIFIQTKGGGLIPSIAYIRIEAKSRATGEQITEQIETSGT